MLVNPGDMPLRRHLIESDVEGRSVDLDTVRHKWNVFLELMRWAEGGSCRHDAILRYFGDEEETLSGCGRCDVCSSLGEEEPEDSEATGSGGIATLTFGALKKGETKLTLEYAQDWEGGEVDKTKEITVVVE